MYLYTVCFMEVVTIQTSHNLNVVHVAQILYANLLQMRKGMVLHENLGICYLYACRQFPVPD